VFIFERISGVWQETDILNGEPYGATHVYGNGGLDIDGRTVVVGDYLYTHGFQTAGAAFVWDHDGSTWLPPVILIGSKGSTSDRRGWSVALDGKIMVMGGPSEWAEPTSPSSPRPGAVHVFGRHNGPWSERLRILPSDLALANFGQSVGISRGLVIVGTHSGAIATNNADGVAYAFDLTCAVEPCEGDFEPDGDVDGSDLAVFAADFGRIDCASGPPCEGDFDKDNDVDGSDLVIFAADFGRTDCP
jgi:hypothetical protein